MESKDSPTERRTQGLGRGSLTTLQKRGSRNGLITINQEIIKLSFGKMEKDDINTFGGRSEFFGGMYPMMTLGLYLQWWVGHKVYFSSLVNSRDWIDWVLLGTSENFT